MVFADEIEDDEGDKEDDSVTFEDVKCATVIDPCVTKPTTNLLSFPKMNVTPTYNWRSTPRCENV